MLFSQLVICHGCCHLINLEVQSQRPRKASGTALQPNNTAQVWKLRAAAVLPAAPQWGGACVWGPGSPTVGRGLCVGPGLREGATAGTHGSCLFIKTSSFSRW